MTYLQPIAQLAIADYYIIPRFNSSIAHLVEVEIIKYLRPTKSIEEDTLDSFSDFALMKKGTNNSIVSKDLRGIV